MIDIFQYMDYREFLKERYQTEKKKNPSFSYRFFARMAGYKSPSVLKMVMDGQRGLSVSAIHNFCKAFKLSVRESVYFEALVHYNQATNDKELSTYYDRLVALRPKNKFKGIEKDQYEFFTERHFVFIREMVALPDFQEDPAWIAKHVFPRITTAQAVHAIEVLLRLKFLKRSKSGKLMQSDATLTTPIEVESADLYHLHRSLLELAKEGIRITPPEMRDITSLTIPLPLSAVAKVKQKLLDFKEELADWVNKQGTDYHEVFQINMQLFPVTDTKLHGGKKP